MGSEADGALYEWAMETREIANIWRATSLFDQWLGWLPYRILSKRIRGEVVGDGIEKNRRGHQSRSSVGKSRSSTEALSLFKARGGAAAERR